MGLETEFYEQLIFLAEHSLVGTHLGSDKSSSMA